MSILFKYFFLVQLDFQVQKCEIKEFITKSTNKKYHFVCYILNIIVNSNMFGNFWYNAKNRHKKITNIFWMIL